MKFNEIRNKIKNLGNFKSVKEIKKAGLRIVYNRKDDSYWLIEKEFLKPCIRSISRIQTPQLTKKDEKEFIIMCDLKQKTSGKFITDYLKYGEKLKINSRPTLKSRNPWWNLGENWKPGVLLWSYFFTDRYLVALGNRKIYGNKEFFLIYPVDDKLIEKIFIVLNSTYIVLWIELFGIGNIPSLIKTRVYEIPAIPIVLLKGYGEEVKKALRFFKNREIKSIFEELGFDKNKPIREQEPNPLPDRKALDDIVFDTLGLTEEERKEVYWAVAELVKNRLEKARSV